MRESTVATGLPNFPQTLAGCGAIDSALSFSTTPAGGLDFLDLLPDAVACVDADGKVVYWNQAAALLYGWSKHETMGRGLVDRFASETRDAWRLRLAAAMEGDESRDEFEDRRRDGGKLWVDARVRRLVGAGEAACLVIVIRDLSDRRRQHEDRARMDHQFLQSQKMETLGNLAGGIAHDFNNLLASIIGYSEIAAELLPPDHPALAKLANVRGAGQRAAELVRRILAFSRAGEQTRRPVRLAQIIEETVPLLRASLPSTIRLVARVAPDADHTVLADPTRLQQIILNLCTNAAQAAGSRPGGLVEIGLDAVDLAVPPSTQTGAIAPGPALRLLVRDNGGGIAPEIMGKIFDPFFTTKPAGEGTGLGLSIVNGIVSALGGAIRVESEPGRGTSFQVFLPARPDGEESNGASPSTASAAATEPACPRGRGEKVAVIDDEESVALLTQMALERHGYTAEIMPDAPACLEILRARPEAFALVVTDQTMPLMTGLELVEALRAHSLQTPVLILSGYSDALDGLRRPALGRVGFLAKPFVLGDLLEHVRAIVRPQS